MASVTLNGVTYTDDSNAVTGLANGGHRTRFVPALSNFLAEAAIQIAATSAAGAEQVSLATTQAGNASTSKIAAQAAETAAELAQSLAEDAQVGAEAALTSVDTLLNSPNWSATSATSLAISIATKTLTVQTGKFFYPGMTLRIFYDGSNYMTGVCTSYATATGVLVVQVVAIIGSGTYTSWTIGLGQIIPASAAPTSTLLTSGTSWTCPAGVFAVKVRMVGGGGGGAGINASAGYGSGDGAGGVEFIQTVTPGTSYSYTIGAAGADGNTGSTDGTAGGNTTIFSVTAEGGGAGSTGTARNTPGGVSSAPTGSMVCGGSAGLDSRASNGDFHKGGDSMLGFGGITQAVNESTQRRLPQGYGAGGARQHATFTPAAQAGTQGCIILDYSA